MLVLQLDREVEPDLLGRGLERGEGPAGQDDGPHPQLLEPGHGEAGAEAPQVE